MNIAMIAHDNRKRLMANLCVAYRHILTGHTVYATASTGQVAEEALNTPVHKLLAGKLGGEQQMASYIASNDIDAVVFLRDPQETLAGDPDGQELIELCDRHNIPLATNLATAELVLTALGRGDLDWRENLK